ncbi:MAG: carbon-nitrogen hydrolase family protein [Candidatus Omnitrophica bacterium]|nr:carbon-nitrogen hydrolase family protein [Candidatus Omnitrophota bacterium]
MKVALLQLCAGRDKKENLSLALAMSQEAIAGRAEFILLPEVFNFRGDLRDKEVLEKAAEKISGPSVTTFIPLAKKHKVSFLLGSMIEKAPLSLAYNTSVFIDSRGEVTAKYRKMHLFDAIIGDRIVRESDCFRKGRHPVTVNIGEFRAGLSICYDLRFPDLYQNYARRRVDLLTVPSCFTKKTGEAHWETLLRARAIENLSYVLAPNQVGIDARGMQAYGHSMIISPWGEVLARAGAEAREIIYGDIDIKEVKKARAILPGIIK